MSADHRADKAAACIRAETGEPPRVAVVLGSGLDAAAVLDGAVSVPYDRIPGWPGSTVAGHAGRFEVGRLGSHRAAVLHGRVHLYEGHPPERVVFPARVLARLGVRVAILTNAAGGLNPAFAPGDLLMIRDHLNLQGGKPPAEGGAVHSAGPETYDPALRAAVREAASALRIPLREGVYAAVRGPSYETPAEARWIRFLGADAVGMSTVPEALALCGAGVRVAAFSVVTNVSGGEASSHAEVLSAGARAAAALGRLLRGLLDRLPAL
jgi:purine-nucleoside phosphorylase